MDATFVAETEETNLLVRLLDVSYYLIWERLMSQFDDSKIVVFPDGTKMIFQSETITIANIPTWISQDQIELRFIIS